MTQDGLKRIIELFLEDIDKLTYTQNGELKEKKVLESNIDETTVRILFRINSGEEGEFKDFKLIGKKGTIYAIKNISINKIGDSMIHEFSFKFVVEEE